MLLVHSQVSINIKANVSNSCAVFFWAPTFKWAITFSNIGDLQKPAEKISPYQQVAIFATGLLWTRYSFVVVPVNYNLAVANVFMAASAGFQLYRKM